MPSLKDRYSYKMGTAVPNPDLEAEHNLTFEGGLPGRAGHEDVVPGERLLQPDRRHDPALLPAAEPLAAAQHRRGVATPGSNSTRGPQVVPRLDLGANYTYLDRNNISDPSVPLVDAPRHKGRVSATVTVVSVGEHHRAASISRRDGVTQNEAGNYKDVAAFAVVNLKASWTVHRHVRRRTLGAERHPTSTSGSRMATRRPGAR